MGTMCPSTGKQRCIEGRGSRNIKKPAPMSDRPVPEWYNRMEERCLAPWAPPRRAIRAIWWFLFATLFVDAGATLLCATADEGDRRRRWASSDGAGGEDPRPRVSFRVQYAGMLLLLWVLAGLWFVRFFRERDWCDGSVLIAGTMAITAWALTYVVYSRTLLPPHHHGTVARTMSVLRLARNLCFAAWCTYAFFLNLRACACADIMPPLCHRTQCPRPQRTG